MLVMVVEQLVRVRHRYLSENTDSLVKLKQTNGYLRILLRKEQHANPKFTQFNRKILEAFKKLACLICRFVQDSHSRHSR